MSRRLSIAKAGVVVASVALGSIVGGLISVSAAPTSVVVCASKSTGALRYSKVGTCRTTETKLTLGQEGPAGATGATGATGPAGSYSGVVGLRTISAAAATLELGDQGKTIVVTGNTDITVPTDSSVAFPVGTRIEIARTTGSPTLSPAVGVTVNALANPEKISFESSRTYQVGVLLKTGTNAWVFLRVPDPL